MSAKGTKGHGDDRPGTKQGPSTTWRRASLAPNVTSALNHLRTRRSTRKTVDHVDQPKEPPAVCDAFQKEQPYHEWTTPVEPPGSHFLDLIGKRGAFKTEPTPVVTDLGKTNDPPPPSLPPKIRLHICLNAYELVDIDLAAGTFRCTMRLYMLWRVDFDDAEYSPFVRFLEKANCNGSHYSLSDKEVADISEAVRMPKVSLLNAADQTTIDQPSVRVYGGETPAMMYNQAFQAVYKQVFPLHYFPFDVQQLRIELQQNDARVWDLYDLSVCTIQFKRSVLDLQEWTMLEPEVQRGSPAHKCTIVYFNLARKPEFYATNIVHVVQTLAGLGLLVFFFDVDEFASRMNTLLTLLLTTVAFKLVISGSLPKVAYCTKMDLFLSGHLRFFCVACFTCAIAYVDLRLKWLCSLETLTHASNNSSTRSTADCNASFESLSNLVAFGVCVAMLVGINIRWLLDRPKKDSVHTRKPITVDQRNWYSFAFANPGFLPKPELPLDC